MEHDEVADTASLSKVIDYCKYHKDTAPEEIQKLLKSTHLMICGISEWNAKYVNIEHEVPDVAHVHSDQEHSS